jgi:phage-related protein
MSKHLLQKRTEYGTFKKVIMHHKAKDTISLFPKTVRFELGHLLYLLQTEVVLNMPQARPMSIIALGAYEIRIRAEDGNYRVFYYTKNRYGILVFHAFIKKSQKTPKQEIELGKKRLADLQEKL